MGGEREENEFSLGNMASEMALGHPDDMQLAGGHTSLKFRALSWLMDLGTESFRSQVPPLAPSLVFAKLLQTQKKPTPNLLLEYKRRLENSFFQESSASQMFEESGTRPSRAHGSHGPWRSTGRRRHSVRTASVLLPGHPWLGCKTGTSKFFAS